MMQINDRHRKLAGRRGPALTKPSHVAGVARIFDHGHWPGPAHIESMSRRSRFAPVVLPWLTGAALLLSAGAIAAQQAPQTSAVETDMSSARAAPLVAACRNEAEKRAAAAKGVHSVQWNKTAPPEVTRSPSGTGVTTRVSLAGWARSGDDWVAITAQCAFDKGRPAVVSLDLAPIALSAAGLDLSGIAPLPDVPAQTEAALPSLSRSPPRTDPPEASGASTVTPTLRKTTPDLPPTITKGQDFLHDHRFGIELQTPF
jgi:hypothetical protein